MNTITYSLATKKKLIDLTSFARVNIESSEKLEKYYAAIEDKACMVDCGFITIPEAARTLRKEFY